MSFPAPIKPGINYLQLPLQIRLWSNYLSGYWSDSEYKVKLKPGYSFSDGSDECSEFFIADLIRQLRKAIPNP